MRRIGFLIILIFSLFLITSCSSKEKLERIEVEKTKNQEVYQNDEYLYENIIVYAFYSNDKKKDVTFEATFSHIDTSTLGEKEVTVTFEGKQTTYTVMVVPVPSRHIYELKVYRLPDKLEYKVNEELDLYGLDVMVVIDGVSEVHIHPNNCTVTLRYYNKTKDKLDREGLYDVLLKTTYEGEEISTSFSIEVFPVQTGLPTVVLHADTTHAQTTYKVGDEFSPLGVHVYVQDLDGSNQTVISIEQCEFIIFFNGIKQDSLVLNQEGEYIIRITYRELYCSYKINANTHNPVCSIKLNIGEAKTDFRLGEAFSLSGVIVEYYEDDVLKRTIIGSNCTYSLALAGTGYPKTTLDERGVYDVYVTYNNLTEKYRITVQ